MATKGYDIATMYYLCWCVLFHVTPFLSVLGPSVVFIGLSRTASASTVTELNRRLSVSCLQVRVFDSFELLGSSHRLMSHLHMQSALLLCCPDHMRSTASCYATHVARKFPFILIVRISITLQLARAY